MSTLLTVFDRSKYRAFAANRTYGDDLWNAVDQGIVHLDYTWVTADVIANTARAVVPAPGAGKAVVIEGVLAHKPAGTAYAGIDPTENLVFRYAGEVTNIIQIETIGFLDQTGATQEWGWADDAAGPELKVNTAVNVSLLGPITTGDSDIRLRVFYRIVDVTTLGA